MVVGHYGCGGVKASMENVDLGLVENWLRNLRDIQRIHSGMTFYNFTTLFSRRINCII